MLKIGVLGAGHLGKIHLKLIKEIPELELVGFFDPNQENAEKAAIDLEVKCFDDIPSLMAEVDALDIVTPTLSHYDCAVDAIKLGKHVFIEKPITPEIIGKIGYFMIPVLETPEGELVQDTTEIIDYIEQRFAGL